MINKMTNGFRNVHLRFLAGVLMLLAASAQFTAAQAEESSTPAKPEPAAKSATPSQTTPEKTPQPATKVVKTPDEFTPSEEISEDFAVSFPVDI